MYKECQYYVIRCCDSGFQWSVINPTPITSHYGTLTNHNGCNQQNEPIRTLIDKSTCKCLQVRENAYEQITIGFSFTSD